MWDALRADYAVVEKGLIGHGLPSHRVPETPRISGSPFGLESPGSGCEAMPFHSVRYYQKFVALPNLLR